MTQQFQQLRFEDIPPAVPRRGNAFTRWFGRSLLRLVGWRILGQFPDAPKIMMIGAPHTSNFDAVIGYAASLMLGVRLSIMIKSTAFKGPMGVILRWLGATPVNRSKATGMVEQTVAAYQRAGKVFTVIMPEGTRKSSPKWKSGFYHVAYKAEAALVPAVLNYRDRSLTFMPVFSPMGDFEADLPRLLHSFVSGVPRYPARLSKPMAELLGYPWTPRQPRR